MPDVKNFSNYTPRKPQIQEVSCSRKQNRFIKLGFCSVHEFCAFDMQHNSNCNVMKLLTDSFDFSTQAEVYWRLLFGSCQSLTEQPDSMYIAPSVRWSIRQTLKIVDEIVDIEKSVPEKIFIEIARSSQKELKVKRTVSRKPQLMALYSVCREEEADLLPKPDQEDNNSLRSDRNFLNK